jgi:hypothetical protein
MEKFYKNCLKAVYGIVLGSFLTYTISSASNYSFAQKNFSKDPVFCETKMNKSANQSIKGGIVSLVLTSLGASYLLSKKKKKSLE